MRKSEEFQGLPGSDRLYAASRLEDNILKIVASKDVVERMPELSRSFQAGYVLQAVWYLYLIFSLLKPAATRTSSTYPLRRGKIFLSLDLKELSLYGGMRSIRQAEREGCLLVPGQSFLRNGVLEIHLFASRGEKKASFRSYKCETRYSV